MTAERHQAECGEKKHSARRDRHLTHIDADRAKVEGGVGAGAAEHVERDQIAARPEDEAASVAAG